jgi:hypothetical protein
MPLVVAVAQERLDKQLLMVHKLEQVELVYQHLSLEQQLIMQVVVEELALLEVLAVLVVTAEAVTEALVVAVAQEQQEQLIKAEAAEVVQTGMDLAHTLVVQVLSFFAGLQQQLQSLSAAVLQVQQQHQVLTQ